MAKRILVVDDNAEARELVRMSLETRDYELEEAEDGWDAMRKVREFQPDLVLLDVMMPGGKNGFQVCSEIKADPELAHIPVIFLTAVRDFQSPEMRKRVRSDGHIMKPFSPAALADRLESFLGE